MDHFLPVVDIPVMGASIMKKIVSFLLVFIIALAIGMAGDHFEINRYVKYVLMIAAIVLTQNMIRRLM